MHNRYRNPKFFQTNSSNFCNHILTAQNREINIFCLSLHEMQDRQELLNIYSNILTSTCQTYLVVLGVRRLVNASVSWTCATQLAKEQKNHAIHGRVLICRHEMATFIVKSKGPDPDARGFLPDQETDSVERDDRASNLPETYGVKSGDVYIRGGRKGGRGRGRGRSGSPCGHRERTNSLSAVTVVEGSYLLGPMSVPSKSRNFTSIDSFPPAMSPGRIVPCRRIPTTAAGRLSRPRPAEESVGRGKAAELDATRGRSRRGSREGSAFSFS